MGLRGWTAWMLTAALATGTLGVVATSAQSPRTVARAAVAVRNVPVVVELFTAQGCGGCPEANQRIEGLAGRPGVILLTYPVDYWDYTGWTDTLARPEFTARQQAYREALELRAVSTPQVILDGYRPLAPRDEDTLTTAIDEEARRRLWAPDIEFRAGGQRVGIGSGRLSDGPADVVAVIFQPGTQAVRVEGGDNRGQVVRQTNVVRSIEPIGTWTGQPVLLSLPEIAEPGDRVAVLIQSREDRHILGAAVR